MQHLFWQKTFSVRGMLVIVLLSPSLNLETLLILRQPTVALSPHPHHQQCNLFDKTKLLCKSTMKQWFLWCKGELEAPLDAQVVAMEFSQKLLANCTSYFWCQRLRKGREGRRKEFRGREWEMREKGKRGRRRREQGRQPVAHDPQIASSYSTSLCSCVDGAQLKEPAAVSWKHIFASSLMCFLLTAFRLAAEDPGVP